MIFVFQISYAKDNKKTDNILAYNTVLESYYRHVLQNEYGLEHNISDIPISKYGYAFHDIGGNGITELFFLVKDDSSDDVRTTVRIL